MKKFKLLVPVLLTFVALSSVPVAAAELPTITIDSETTISPQSQQTEWVYRTYNGVLQKRLWSNTNQCWLTDWIDCE